MKKFATVVYALIASASALHINFACSDVKPIDDFNIDAFANGVWYEIARYPTDWEDHSDCLVAKFTHEGNSYKFSISDVLDNTHKSGSFGGDVEVANANKKVGIINYISPVYKAFTGTNKMTARIVNVNYDHFCIFYECEYDEDQKVQKDHVWILSRSIIENKKPDCKNA